MSKHQIVYPPSGRVFFDGGKNNKYEPTIIDDNQSPDCLNVVFNAAAVETRPGFTKVNTASVGSYVCDGLYVRKGTNNAQTMVAFYNGTGFTLDGTSLVTIGSAQSVFTAGVRVGSAQMENHAFFGNGGVIPYKYNGTAWTRHGVYPPSFVASLNSNGAGNPNGDYQYKFTYVNSASVESDVSDVSSTFTVASKQISITSIPVAPQSFGVASRRIYRTEAGGTTFKRVTELSDNTTTSYTDNVADASLGVTAPTNKGVPPKYSFIFYHKNRLFMNDADNPGFLWYTDLNEPYTVASTNFIVIGDQSSDFVKSAGVHNDNVVVFGEKDPWLIFMPSTDASTWTIIKCRSPFISKSPFGLYNYNNMLGFPAMQNDKLVGFGAISGDSITPSTSTLSIGTMVGYLRSDNIEPDIFDIQEAHVGNISSIVYKNGVYISLTKGSGNTTNNYVYYLDISPDNSNGPKTEAWVPWTGINAAQFAIYNRSLYWGSSTANGFLYTQTEGTYNDNGSAINSYYWTKEFAGRKGQESNNKDFRFANILVDLPGNYFMYFSYLTDSDTGSGTNYQVDLNPGQSLWGTMIWGVDDWGGGAAQADLKIPIGGSIGNRIKFKFSNQNTANQMFKVHWMNFRYNLKGVR